MEREDRGNACRHIALRERPFYIDTLQGSMIDFLQKRDVCSRTSRREHGRQAR